MALLHDDEAGLRFDVDEAEVRVLRDLLGYVDTVLGDDDGDTLPAVAGQARDRLLPDAHREDPDIAAAHRDLTEQTLREDKRADLGMVLAALPVVEGAARVEEPEVWLRALNDIRLTLGVELGITEDSEPPRRVRTPQDLRLSVYFWLTYLQESLVQTLMTRPG